MRKKEEIVVRAIKAEAENNIPRRYYELMSEALAEIFKQGAPSADDLMRMRKDFSGWKIESGAMTVKIFFFFPPKFVEDAHTFGMRLATTGAGDFLIACGLKIEFLFSANSTAVFGKKWTDKAKKLMKEAPCSPTKN